MIHRIVRGLRHLAVICCCVLGFATIVATGGGGGGSDSGPFPTPTADATGGWTGTLTTGDASVYEVVGVVAPDGEMRMFDSLGIQYVAFVSVTGNTGTGTFTGYAPEGVIFPNGEPITSGSVTCTIVEKTSITGSYTVEGDSGTFSLNYGPGLERPLDFPNEVAGQWGYYNSADDWVTITIDFDGAFTGTNNLGCEFSGTFLVMDPSWDILDINLAAAQCEDFDGSYSGLGFIGFDPEGDMLFLMVSSPTISYLGVYVRNPGPT